MKKIILSLIMLLSLTAAGAQSLTIEAADGTEGGMYDIDNIQRIDLTTPGTIRIVTKDGQTAEFNSNNMPRINFTATTTAISAPATAVKAGSLRAWADGDIIYVSGTKAGEDIAVFALNGVRIAKGKAADGVTAVSAVSMPKGVYVIKAGKDAVKVIVR